MKIGPAIPEICSRTDRHADAHDKTDRNTNVLRSPTGAESYPIIIIILITRFNSACLLHFEIHIDLTVKHCYLTVNERKKMHKLHLLIRRPRPFIVYRQGRRHGFESGVGTNSASEASRNFFLTPAFWPVEEDKILLRYIAKSA